MFFLFPQQITHVIRKYVKNVEPKITTHCRRSTNRHRIIELAIKIEIYIYTVYIRTIKRDN